LQEEEKIVVENYIGVNSAGKQYSYDASIIWDKLKKGDYSNNGEKIVFLTFDDGTSTTNTPKILDILRKENVKATFFLSGKNIEGGGDKAKELVKREFDDGHAIANHSYSHDYKILYPNRILNLNNFIDDFKKTDELLKSIIGDNFSTRVLRCPGGHMSWKEMDKLDAYLKENNMVSIDWNALSKDAEGKKKNSAELVQEVIKSSQGKEIVVLLMHDTYGKEETVKSLPEIIKYFKDNGYSFKTLV
ncbi:MAG: polysaccharide deacetylase family protein, partial [Clostridium sp.]